MKRYIFSFLLSVICVFVCATSLADGYRREIHVTHPQFPYMYVPTDGGVYTICSGYENVYHPFPAQTGRNQPTYVFYSTEYKLKDVVCNDYNIYTAVTDNDGDSNLLLLIEKDKITDVTPSFITSGSKSSIEQIEMQSGDETRYPYSDETTRVYLRVSGDHAGVYMHPKFRGTYSSWTKVFDKPVNFIAASGMCYEIVLCYTDSLGNNRVIMSNDQGVCEKWREIYNTNKFEITNSVHCGSFICLYNKDVMVVSGDNAATWSEIRPPFKISDIVYLSKGEMLAAESSDTISRIWRSLDYGATWSEFRTIPEDSTGIVDMAFCLYSLVMYTGSGKIYSMLHYDGTGEYNIRFNGIPTSIKEVQCSTDDNIAITITAGGLSVDLGAATDWSATLYNSNGVTVAQQQGNGSEIFLPTDSKGTHILVVKAGGKVVKKKVLLR